MALSPQAKGRVERMAETFQDRLVTELRLAGASSIEEANSVLEQFLPRFNRRFRVPPQYPEPAFRPLDPELCLALAAVEQAPVGEWAQAREYERYLGSSVKGEAAIDWADRQARAALLAKIVADADRLLELSRQAQGELAEDSEERQRIVAAAELLGQLLLQSLPPAPNGGHGTG